jgi:hypothetical protein
MCLAGVCLSETTTLLGVSSAAISKVMPAYTNHGKATSAKRNSGWKSLLTERLCRTLRCTVSKNHRTTAARVTWQNWIFILKTLFPQKLSDASFTNPISTVGLQLLNFWLLKAVLRCVNHGVTTIKSGNQTTVNALSFTLFPTSEKVYVWRTPKEAYNPECLVPTVKHGEGSVMVWTTISRYSIGTIVTLHGRTTAEGYVDRLGNQVHSMIQTLFPNSGDVLQDDNAPIHTAGTVQSWFEKHEGELQHLSWPA